MNIRNINWVITSILLLIAVIGLILRAYNLDFPSIGYHNMKENEYLSMAQEMSRTGDFTTRRIYFYNAFDDNPDMQLFPQIPVVTYQILASWKLAGENLWGPRLINAMFGVLAIPVMYFMGLLLFESAAIALFCSFLLAIMPLGVFFSRNLQPESPAFFFMLLGSLFYLRFAKFSRMSDLFLGGVAFSAAWIYKMNFLIGVLPVFFCFPYRRIFIGKRLAVKTILLGIISYSAIFLALAWLIKLGQWQFKSQATLDRVKFLEVFSWPYWKQYGRIIWWYTQGENYSYLFTGLALFGFAASFWKTQGLLKRYILGGVLALIAYAMLFSDFINQHNYYQMPFLGIVCVACAYALLLIARFFKKVFNKELLLYLLFLIVIISGFFVSPAIKRMYSAVFFGGDVAGDSLREFTAPQERIFLSTYAQGYSVARYAQRYVGWPANFTDFKIKEKQFGVRFICFYPPFFLEGLEKSDPELFKYIQDNYHLKEFGFLDGSGQLSYLILEKGRGEVIKDTLKTLSAQPQMRTIYKVSGNLFVFYSVRPPENTPVNQDKI